MGAKAREVTVGGLVAEIVRRIKVAMAAAYPWRANGRPPTPSLDHNINICRGAILETGTIGGC